MGWGAGALRGFDTPSALFMGLILGATSVHISAQTLMELKVMLTRVGLGLLGAAVFDDILVILLLSTVLAVFSGGLGSILFIFLSILLCIGSSIALGIWGLPWLMRRVSRLEVSHAALSMALVIMFLYALTADVVGGRAAITGTFIAGLMVARSPEMELIERGVRAIAYSLFVPIFFVSFRLGINLRETNSVSLLLLFVIITIGIFGKMLGSGLGALSARFTQLEALQLGAGMVSRGEVGLIVAAIGMKQGYVQNSEFSAAIGMVVITTHITPPLLRGLFASEQAAGALGKYTANNKKDIDTQLIETEKAEYVYVYDYVCSH